MSLEQEDKPKKTYKLKAKILKSKKIGDKSLKITSSKVSKTVRFEVFKRDGFACQYCGRTPPAVTLECDHINPASKNGPSNMDNLITACFDCNRGKRNIPLSKIPNSLKENLELLKEKENQLKEYNKFIEKINKRYLKEAEDVNEIYSAFFEGWVLSDYFIATSLRKFQDVLLKQDIVDAMVIACSKVKNRDESIKYFCGVCWGKIKAKTDPLYNTIIGLKQYWFNQPRGSGYISEINLRKWVEKYGEKEVKEKMDKAEGLWRLLKESMD